MKKIKQGLFDMLNSTYESLDYDKNKNYEPIYIMDDLKKRTDECSECDIMANYEDPDKWDGVKKCPKCGKDTEILKQSWD